MKTSRSSRSEESADTSSAPAADRPATALDSETPQPTVLEDTEARILLAEDPLGNLPLPPEIVSPRLAELETWDAPAGESGYRVPPQAAEDEAEFPEVLAEEGADEAEEERLAVQQGEEERLERELEEADEEEEKTKNLKS
ncbi:hypothetical protein [Prosthecobacter sp.]|uniref:hypothetical protein n=1 Tax=Prosthecobacter sp. TaxID=1965333 RepID=UPI003784D7CB